jgi:hypothetical protein
MDLQARPIRFVAQALAGYVDVLEGRAPSGLQAIRTTIEQSRRQPSAPGMQAILERILLAGCVAAGDAPGTDAGAQRLLDMGGPGRVWAAQAHQQRAVLSDRPRVESPANFSPRNG